VFATRWRWNANISLAIPRFRGGKKVPPPLQRMEADDLLAAAFPDAAACLENIAGDREIPDHPLVEQVIEDCLHEAMDLTGLVAVLRGLERGDIQYLARDLPEPSPLAHEILNAKPYAFLDDAPLEERRTQAVQTRRAFEPGSADDLGALDLDAILRVRDEAWPEVEHADELHDALMVSGFLTAPEGIAGRDGRSWEPFFQELVRDGRAVAVEGLWLATERVGSPTLERIRGRLEITGPITAAALSSSLGVDPVAAEAALLALEAEGVVLRGGFTPGGNALEWCERRLLARIHRYTLNRLRAEIAPVSGADFTRFLFGWQRVTPDERGAGLEGLAGVIEQLDGYQVPAAAWESDVLAVRCQEYDPALLDMLCLTGRVAWGRLSGTGAPGSGNGGGGSRPIRSTPIALFGRDQADLWLDLAGPRSRERLSANGATLLEVLGTRGASFFPELTAASGLLPTQVEQALGELAAQGLVTSDSFAGLRALLTPSAKRRPLGLSPGRQRRAPFGIERAGRWSLLGSEKHPSGSGNLSGPVETYARILLRRYGVVFHRLLARESITLPWRDLLMVYRRLEARGEIRGGRFLAGVTGEQFALPEAVVQLRSVRRTGGQAGGLITISAADPLNLVGIVGPGERIPAIAPNRIVFEDGKPVAVLEGGEVRFLAEHTPEQERVIATTLARRPISAALRVYLGMSGRPVGTAVQPWRRRKVPP
jgi:ATP-dependent Lhr-like helicase